MKDELFVNLILSSVFPKYLIKPLKLILRTPLIKANVEIKFNDEDTENENNALDIEQFLKLIKAYKDSGLMISEVIDIFNKQLEKYKIELVQLPKLVYKCWDIV